MFMIKQYQPLSTSTNHDEPLAIWQWNAMLVLDPNRVDQMSSLEIRIGFYYINHYWPLLTTILTTISTTINHYERLWTTQKTTVLVIRTLQSVSRVSSRKVAAALPLPDSQAALDELPVGLLKSWGRPGRRKTAATKTSRIWLVVTGCHDFYFPIHIGNAVFIPIDEVIFFRGLAKNHQPGMVEAVLKQLFDEPSSPASARKWSSQDSSTEKWNFFLSVTGRHLKPVSFSEMAVSETMIMPWNRNIG